MAKELAVVLSSGSLNSTVTAALAAQKFRIILINVETGEPIPRGQRVAYDGQVAHFKPYREHTLPAPFLSMALPSATVIAAADPRQGPPLAPQMVQLLPLVAIGVRFAVHYRAAALHLGLRVGPAADALAQASEYVQVWSELIQLPCAEPELQFETPLLELEPWQVVDVGYQASTPFEKSWSCTEGGSEPCWACAGCRAREAAFQQAAKPDPLRAVKK